MKNILTAPFMTELIRTVTNMYAQGWDERNGGNVSVLLEESALADYLDLTKVCRRMPTGFAAPELEGAYFLVTGTGKYFKNVQYAPERDLGILRLAENGRVAELLWGLADGGNVTSEFPAHMMSHAARRRVDPENRVIMHCHPTNLLAMTHVHDLDERAFTRTLWQMCTECLFVFPEGVNVLPWMVCGTKEIGEATAKKMETARLVVWAQHGIYGAGRDLDEAFGLIETAEKAAEIYLKIAHLPRVNTITDDQLHKLEARFGVIAREGYLAPPPEKKLRLRILRRYEQLDGERLMAVYAEGNAENAREFYPDLPASEGIRRVEAEFLTYLQEGFYLRPDPVYYVLEEDGCWISALRLNQPEKGSYYLEALETRPDRRRQGHAVRLLQMVLAELQEKGLPFRLCDCVDKDNLPSLHTHLKCGFRIAGTTGCNLLDGSTNPRAYSMEFDFDPGAGSGKAAEGGAE